MRLSQSMAAGLATLLPLVAAGPPSVSSLMTSAHNFAASLKSSYPNPSIALLAPPLLWWESGSSIDALLGYTSTTGDTQYESLLQNTILSQTTGTNDFMTPSATGNDDQAWWALAAMTAAEMGLPQAGSVAWLTFAQNVFNDQKARWDTTSCGGGMKWQISPSSSGWHYKNSIANGLFFQLAARLAKLTGDADAQAWAEKTYDWVVSVGLIDGQFNVYDGTDDTTGCTSLNHDQWSYNVGVFLYGTAVMAAQTQNATWTDRTTGFIASAKRTFTNPATGALFEQMCEAAGTCDTDQVSFKGTLARWLGATALVLPAVNADVAGITDGAANAVQSGPSTGLGAMQSFTALEVVDASLRTQGYGGVAGVIGLSKRVVKSVVKKRSVAGRIVVQW